MLVYENVYWPYPTQYDVYAKLVVLMAIYKTLHVTRLFRSGIDEQRIMTCTGHHSIDSVRVWVMNKLTMHSQIALLLLRSARVFFKNEHT